MKLHFSLILLLSLIAFSSCLKQHSTDNDSQVLNPPSDTPPLTDDTTTSGDKTPENSQSSNENPTTQTPTNQQKPEQKSDIPNQEKTDAAKQTPENTQNTNEQNKTPTSEEVKQPTENKQGQNVEENKQEKTQPSTQQNKQNPQTPSQNPKPEDGSQNKQNPQTPPQTPKPEDGSQNKQNPQTPPQTPKPEDGSQNKQNPQTPPQTPKPEDGSQNKQNPQTPPQTPKPEDGSQNKQNPQTPPQTPKPEDGSQNKQNPQTPPQTPKPEDGSDNKPNPEQPAKQLTQEQQVQKNQKQQAQRVAKQEQKEQQQKQKQQKQQKNIIEEGQKKMKQLQEQMLKNYEPKSEDKAELTNNLDDLSTSTDQLQKNLQSRLLNVNDQAAHHHHAVEFYQTQMLHQLTVSQTKCYNLTDAEQKLLDDKKAALQSNLTKLKIFLDKAKLDPTLANQTQITTLQTKYDTTLAQLNKLRLIKRCTPDQVKKTTPSATPVNLPTGMGISEAQSYFKNITNLNAPNWIVGNQTIDDYTSKLFNFLTHNNITKCKLQTPFARKSDNQCIKCQQPKPVFDLKLGDCVSCPAGTKLDPQTHKCVAAPPSSKCKSNYVWNEQKQKCVCPDAFPIDLGCECVTCLEPFAWDVNQKACKLRCPQSQNWNKQKQTCECPSSSPYKINGQCISCNLPFEWQASSQTCEIKSNNCPTTTTPTTPITPITPPQTCTSNYVFDSSIKQCVCPPSLPFNNGVSCVQCNLPQYWDHQSKSCLYCPNLKYFSTLTRNCEFCPADKPLYRNYACQSCPSGTTYDSTSNSCTPNSDDNFIDPATTAKVPVSTI